MKFVWNCELYFVFFLENTSSVELVDQNSSFDITPDSSQVVGVIELPHYQATETTGIPVKSAEKLDSIAQKLDLWISVASANEVIIQMYKKQVL